MSEIAPVVIIGAGCIGASIAHHLGRLGVKGVVVLEKEPFAGAGSTSKAAGGVRAQFSTPINVRMSMLSVSHYLRFADEMGCDPVFFPVGYLFLVSDPAQWQSFRAHADMQRGLGLDVRTLSAAEARALVPELHVDDLVGATFCPTDGLCNPHEITQAYVAGARAGGARFRFSEPAVGLLADGAQVRGVRTAQGEIHAPVVVNAMGAWAGALGEWAGIEIPIRPVRRHCFTTEPLPFVRDDLPMIVDVRSGVYMHRESGGLLLGYANPEEPAGFETAVNWDLLERVVEPAMHRLPPIETAEVSNAWAGLYETSPDHNALLGPLPGTEGLLLANGFSGHGLMHAPAVGQLMAEWIVQGRPSIDLNDLRPGRFAERDALVEAHVI